MPQFIARGTITKRGATFYLDGCKDIEHARKRAKEGDFDDVEEDRAELVDWTIDVSTVEINE